MRYTLKFILKTSLAITVTGFIVGFTLFQSQNLMRGPTIQIGTSTQGTSNEIAVIEGEAENIAFLTFNDRQIYTDKNGAFREKVLLSEGYNIVKLAAKDKFGKIVERTIELVYEAPEEGGKLSANGDANAQKN
jgi:hypothetical protein